MSQRPQTSSCVALAQSPGPFRARGLAYLESSGKPREWFKACGWRQLKQATSFACLACRAYPMKRPSSTSSSLLPMMVLAHNPLPVLILPLLPPPSLLQTLLEAINDGYQRFRKEVSCPVNTRAFRKTDGPPNVLQLAAAS